MSQIDELKARLEEINAELSTEAQRGGVADQGKIARLQQEYEVTQAQINQLEVEGVAQAIAPNTEEITVGGETYTLDFLSSDEDAAMILRQWQRQIKMQVTERANEWITDVQKVREEYEAKLTEKEEANRALISQVDELQNENGRLILERDDHAEKRDSAVRQYEEMQAEVARLNGHLDDLRKEIALGASGASKVIEIETDADIAAAAQRLKAKKAAEAAEQAAKAEAAKIRIYDLEWADLRHSVYNAKRADNDEIISIRYLQINQYVVLNTPEELARFREEHKAQEETPVVQHSIPGEPTPEASQPIEVPPIGDGFHPAEETQPSHGMDEGNVGESAQGTAAAGVTRAEFDAEIAALKARVSKLEGGSVEVAA